MEYRSIFLLLHDLPQQAKAAMFFNTTKAVWRCEDARYHPAARSLTGLVI